MARVAAICLLLAASGTARAQDMVFSMEDTGQTPSAGGVDAPPSETLANALRLYQNERYAESGVQFQRVMEGGTNDSPANVEKAQFFLAKCLFHLAYYRTALTIFDEITHRGEAHRYFGQALSWLAQLATRLPEPAGIVELVGRYRPELVATFDDPDTAEVHDHLLYLSGRHAYADGDFEAAIDRFERVRRGSEHYAKARFFEGVTHVRMRRARPAIEAFRSVLAAAEAGEVEQAARMRDLAWLSLARVYYTAANRTDDSGERSVDATLLANAIEAWDRVDPSSEHWLDALFEQSWALFLASEEARAMGNIHALFSPYFVDAYYPEALILKAVVFFSACQTDNAEAMVHQFHERYDPVRAELTSTLERLGDNEQLFGFLARVVAGDAELSPRIHAPVSSSLGDRTLRAHLEYVAALDAEQLRLDRAPDAFSGSSLGVRIRQEVLVSRSFAVDRAGDLARGRVSRLIDELDELMIQMDTVEIEMYRVRREGLSEVEIDERQRIGEGGGFNVEVDEEHQIWPFDGEYWRDELPFYRQQVTPICTR